MNLKSRIKQYSFWTGLSAAVVMLANELAKCFGFSIDNAMIENVIMSICGVLVALGVVCMPIKTKKTEDKAADDQTNEDKDSNEKE